MDAIYEKPTIIAMDEDEVLAAFQMTAAEISAAGCWWGSARGCLNGSNRICDPNNGKQRRIAVNNESDGTPDALAPTATPTIP
jgi:hypothetical protein